MGGVGTNGRLEKKMIDKGNVRDFQGSRALSFGAGCGGCFCRLAGKFVDGLGWEWVDLRSNWIGQGR